MVYMPWSGFNPKWMDNSSSKISSQKKRKRSLKNAVIGAADMKCEAGNKVLEGDMRSRANTFDLHQIGGSGSHGKFSLLSKLLHRHSKSADDSDIGKNNKKSRQTDSPSTSPKPSPGAPHRRRFVRVMRECNETGEECLNNPHVVTRFNKDNWERSQCLRRARSMDDYSEDKPLPYVVTGHTILKKRGESMDNSEGERPGTVPSSPAGSPTVSPRDSPTSFKESSPTGFGKENKKSCMFNEEIEILEYDIRDKCVTMSDYDVKHDRVHYDDEFYESESESSRTDSLLVDIRNVQLDVICETMELKATPPPPPPSSNIKDLLATEGRDNGESDSEDDETDNDTSDIVEYTCEAASVKHVTIGESSDSKDSGIASFKSPVCVAEPNLLERQNSFDEEPRLVNIES